jgi:hypothetical protein
MKVFRNLPPPLPSPKGEGESPQNWMFGATLLPQTSNFAGLFPLPIGKGGRGDG